MRHISSLLPVLLILLFTSCGRDNVTIIEGTMEMGSGHYVYLDKLEINNTIAIDSIRIKKNDQFRFKIRIGHPDIYLLRNDKGRFLTILPFPGEKILISTSYDNPGKDYQISGSEESAKIKTLTQKLSDTRAKLRSLDESLEKVSSITDIQAQEYLSRRKEIMKEQRDFSIRFIIENLKSMAGIYAIYQTIDNEQLVLGENRDIQYMKILADSVSVEYPEVPFVKAFVEDARDSERRYYNILNLSDKIQEASIGLPDIALPDLSGKTQKLSDLKGKIVLLYFWASFSPESRQQNPSLRAIYQQYKNQGFEVYAISLDNQPVAWGNAVRIDELDWINVSELKFPDSNVSVQYNVTSLPSNFLINKEGDIIGRDLYGKELEKWLSNLIK